MPVHVQYLAVTPVKEGNEVVSQPVIVSVLTAARQDGTDSG